jgi:hypothetical protein
MADFYPLIARAIAALPENTKAARTALYERAWRALAAEMDRKMPLADELGRNRERQLLLRAIHQAESENDAQAYVPPATQKTAAETEPSQANALDTDKTSHRGQTAVNSALEYMTLLRQQVRVAETASTGLPVAQSKDAQVEVPERRQLSISEEEVEASDLENISCLASLNDVARAYVHYSEFRDELYKKEQVWISDRGIQTRGYHTINDDGTFKQVSQAEYRSLKPERRLYQLGKPSERLIVRADPEGGLNVWDWQDPARLMILTDAQKWSIHVPTRQGYNFKRIRDESAERYILTRDDVPREVLFDHPTSMRLLEEAGLVPARYEADIPLMHKGFWRHTTDLWFWIAGLGLGEQEGLLNGIWTYVLDSHGKLCKKERYTYEDYTFSALGGSGPRYLSVRSQGGYPGYAGSSFVVTLGATDRPDVAPVIYGVRPGTFVLGRRFDIF